jgi:hypothetical protein
MTISPDHDCITCLKPTATGFTARGTIQWISDGLVSIGIPAHLVGPGIDTLDPQWRDQDPDTVHTLGIAYCAECSALTSIPIAPYRPGEIGPGLVQAGT